MIRGHGSKGVPLVAVASIIAVLLGGVTNLFTNVLPADWNWARDWRVLGATLLGLALASIWLAVAVHQRDEIQTGVTTHQASPELDPQESAADVSVHIAVIPRARAERVVAECVLAPFEGSFREPLRRVSARLLGVRQPIQVPGCSDDELAYVPRDVDSELQAAISAAAERGGFVILHGDPSTGKTRTLLQALQALDKDDQDWEVFCPVDVAAIRALSADHARHSHVVVWLDQLERYLDHAEGLPARTVRKLLNTGLLVVGTISDYNARVSRVDGTAGPYDNDREVLRLAKAFYLPADLSSAERQRAQTFVDDERVRIALSSADAGFIQMLTAGPELIRRWEHPAVGEHCGSAVITAAIDADRVGACAPVTKQYLQAAAPAYLSATQRARVDPASWLTHALAYATTDVGTATAALNPVGITMGKTIGYLPAEYLSQYARSRRRAEPVADTVWKALIRHHRRQDTLRLAEGAERRGRLRDAETLYRRLADGGDRTGADRLISLLQRQHRTGEAIEACRPHADNATWTIRLADLFVENGNSDAAIGLLRFYASHVPASMRLATLLAERGHNSKAVDVLLPHAADTAAGPQLLDLLAGQQRRPDAVALLHPYAVDGPTAVAMANMLQRQGWTDEAHSMLEPHVDSADGTAAVRAAELLLETNQNAEAEELLRRCAATGNPYVTTRLADLLTSQGRYDDAKCVLSPHAANDGYAAELLAEVYLALGDTDQAMEVLQRRADNDEYVAVRLADLLLDHDEKDQALTLLRRHARDGDGHAVSRLADLLVECGQVQEALGLLRQHPSNRNCTDQLADLLADQGRVDDAVAELARHAESGDQHAAAHQAKLLLTKDRFDEAVLVLKRHSRARDGYATTHLSALLLKQGKSNDAVEIWRQRSDDGDWIASNQLITFLTQQHRIDDLEQEIAAGTFGALEQWTTLTRRTLASPAVKCPSTTSSR